MQSHVKFEGVHKLFGAETAVEDLNLTVEAGEFMVLVGPSGCGKTTTLRMLAGLERPSYGRILIGDKLVNNVSPRYRDVAMVFQSYALYPHMNVYDNLAFGMRARGAANATVGERVKETAEVLGLGRALIRQPQVFLMDEPLSNLDAGLRVQMRAELSRLHDRFRVTTMYVTHDPVEAMTMGDRIAVMNQGRLQQVDTPETLYDNPANHFVAGFIGSPRMNFVPGQIATDDGKTAVRFLGVKAPLSSSSRLAEGSADAAVTVGIRPEDLMWRPAAGPDSVVTLTAEVDVVEPMGHEAYVTALCAGETVTSRFPPRSGVRTHERVELALNPARLHLFDAQSGESILQRPVASSADALRSMREAWTEGSPAGRDREHEAPGVPAKSEDI